MNRQAMMVAHVRMALADVRRHTLRSLLTILGVVFGVGSVVAMLAVGEGASRQQREQIRRMGSQNILIHSVKPMQDKGSTSRATWMSIYGLLYDDEVRIRETIPGVRRIVPARFLQANGQLGEQRLELRLVETTPEWFELVKRQLIAGRVFNSQDLRGTLAVCVLTEFGARRLLATRHAIGQDIRIGANSFRVIGIVQNQVGEGAVKAPDESVDAYIPITSGRNLFGEVTVRRSSGSQEIELVELHQIIVEVDRQERVPAVANAIRAMLSCFHKREDYRLQVPLALLREAEATQRTFDVVLGSIAGISLLVGGIGIMNIMLASVTERTREIGIRRAIGAKRRQIVVQFLVETVVLSGTGGVLGIGLGLLIPLWITHLSGMPTIVRGYSLLMSFGISVLIGVIFGLYPAVRAARLDPIEALRHE